MSRYSIEGSTLTALGDAIRGKVGDTKEVEVPLEPYTCLIDSQVDYENWPADSLGYRKKTINFQPMKGITHYKLVYSLDTRVYDDNNQIFRSANIYFRPQTGSTTTSYEFTLGDKIEAIVEAPAELDVIEVTVGALYNYFKPDEHYLKLNLTIYPCNGAGNVIETQPGYVFNSMTPIDMAEAINNMGTVPPDSAFNIAGDCEYRFANGGWDWFVELYGDKVTTSDITNCGYMFRYSTMEKIPFDINLNDNITSFNFNYMFENCRKLKELPKINGKLLTPTSSYRCPSMSYIFTNCYVLREIPEGYFNFLPDGYSDIKENFQVNGGTNTFANCFSLRRVPTEAYIANANYGTGYYYSLYNYLHSSNYVLDEAINIPVEPGPYTSNGFNTNSFSNCHRLSRVTFETNEDGTPKIANWKNQIITLGGTTSNVVGYAYNSTHKGNILSYNSGITADKEVNDDATYAALKNDPDWFATSESYSRYNKLSAIETINTLPDVSGSGGTNTIKFRGVAGSATDGGAINTMTEEEIAVATAKGWTVSFV